MGGCTSKTAMAPPVEDTLTPKIQELEILVSENNKNISALQAQIDEMIPRETLTRTEAELHETKTKLETSQFELSESRKQIETLQCNLEELATQANVHTKLNTTSEMGIQTPRNLRRKYVRPPAAVRM